MLLSTVKLDREAFEHGTGWALRPRGRVGERSACRSPRARPSATRSTSSSSLSGWDADRSALRQPGVAGTCHVRRNRAGDGGRAGADPLRPRGQSVQPRVSARPEGRAGGLVTLLRLRERPARVAGPAHRAAAQGRRDRDGVPRLDGRRSGQTLRRAGAAGPSLTDGPRTPGRRALWRREHSEQRLDRRSGDDRPASGACLAERARGGPSAAGPARRAGAPQGDDDRGRADRERSAAYVAALRDWADRGAASDFVLSPEQVVARSGRRGVEEATAAAEFELAQHLYSNGDLESARPYFREAHRLQPDNWTYKRQAWSVEPSALEGPLARFWQGPLPGHESDWAYDGDWVADAKALGPANYYPRFLR